jgi:nitrogen PTS system EIIA component
MKLTVRDVARLFTVSEKTIYRWLDQKSLPGYKINNQYHFKHNELLKWAAAKQIKISSGLSTETDFTGVYLENLSEAIQTGGIYYQVRGKDKNSALHSAVELMQLPTEIDKELLYKVLLEREEIASTGIGDGIAIPHVRNPIIFHVPRLTVSLSFLEEPIDFQSIDNQPVFCLFTIVSPSVRSHLHLLSRLSFALQDKHLKKAIKTQSPREDILSQIGRIEFKLDKTKSASMKHYEDA